MKTRTITSLIVGAAFFVLQQGFVFADTQISCLGYSFSVPGDINLDPQFEGTLMITTPAGQIILVNEGDAIPSIPAGSGVEVFKGKANFKSGADVLTLACENDVEGTGEAKVLTEGVNVIDPTGDKQPLPSGTVYPISILEAPPTAETVPEGTGVGDLPPVDSRSVPQSL